ncbi:MAG: hypothetical protein QXL89_04600 [Nitrososphaeria archaeon]
MGNQIKAKKFGYGEGALATLAIAIGTAAIIYGGGILTFDPINLIAWVLIPLGAYTTIYTLKPSKNPLYYASWGIIMVAIGLTTALYKIVNPIIIFGILLIVLATLGLIAYLKKVKS